MADGVTFDVVDLSVGTTGQGSTPTVTVSVVDPNSLLEIVPGANVTVDNTDPRRPVVSATGGGAGGGIGTVTSVEGVAPDTFGNVDLNLGTASTHAAGDFDIAGAAAAAQIAATAASQPLDSDLTAIAALTTTPFGRSLLALVDAPALRTAAGLGTAATQASTVFDPAGAATAAQAAAQAASQPLDSDLTAIAALATTTFGRSLLTAADAAAARALIGAGTSSLALGTTSSTAKAGDYQPAAANISDASAIGRSVLTAADAAAVRSAIGAGTSSLALGTTGTTAAAGNDSRLSDARTPTAHAASHAAAGSDPLTLAESQVTGLVTDLAGKAASAHTHAESDVTGLVADLAAKVPTNRTIAGHALSADVTLVKGDVGLGNVDNTADTAKTFTESQVTGLVADLAAKAPLASPTFTGHPKGVTEAAADNTTNLATTAYVDRGDGLLVPKSLVTAKGDLIVASASGAVARLGVGSDTQVLTADSTATNGVKWAAAGGGGGGLAAGYLGKNAIGASWFSLATPGVFKKVTTSGATTLLGVAAYLRMNIDAVGNMGVALFTDNAGTPNRLIAFNEMSNVDRLLLNNGSGETGASAVGRWFEMPLTSQLAAATSYWVGIYAIDFAPFDIAYDTSGTDRTFNSNQNWLNDWGRGSVATTTRDHSIRANILA